MSSGKQAFNLVRVDVGVVGAASASDDIIVARDSDELRDDFNWPMLGGMGSSERDEISHVIAASLRGFIRFLRKFMDLCQLYSIAYG
jgi:hypothetical protein